METFVIIDFETTGLDYKTNQVIEIAALKVDENGREIGRFQTFVALERGSKLPPIITELTGITPDDLVAGMTEDDAMDTLRCFLRDSTVIAQYAPFDFSFLDNYQIWPISFVCTRALTFLVEPSESPSLKPTCERHRIKLEGHHRAMNDVMATLEVFKVMRKKADESGIDYRNTVVDFINRPINVVPNHAKIVKESDVLSV